MHGIKSSHVSQPSLKSFTMYSSTKCIKPTSLIRSKLRHPRYTTPTFCIRRTRHRIAQWSNYIWISAFCPMVLLDSTLGAAHIWCSIWRSKTGSSLGRDSGLARDHTADLLFFQMCCDIAFLSRTLQFSFWGAEIHWGTVWGSAVSTVLIFLSLWLVCRCSAVQTVILIRKTLWASSVGPAADAVIQTAAALACSPFAARTAGRKICRTERPLNFQRTKIFGGAAVVWDIGSLRDHQRGTLTRNCKTRDPEKKEDFLHHHHPALQ